MFGASGRQCPKIRRFRISRKIFLTYCSLFCCAFSQHLTSMNCLLGETCSYICIFPVKAVVQNLKFKTPRLRQHIFGLISSEIWKCLRHGLDQQPKQSLSYSGSVAPIFHFIMKTYLESIFSLFHQFICWKLGATYHASATRKQRMQNGLPQYKHFR